MAKESLHELNQAHTVRQLQRTATRGPVLLVGIVGGVVSILIWAGLGAAGVPVLGAVLGLPGIITAVLWCLSAQLLAEWDRAVVLRLGRFRGVRGPGFFRIVPILDRVSRVVDLRVRTTTFSSESMLTRDTVPVGVDAIAFWNVWDPQKAVLEVESFYQAIVMAVQTALRDIVGVYSLADILAEREKISQTLQEVLEQKTKAWGVSVTSIEIRDIAIPEKLKDALSKQAQAERERQARTILGLAETEIAEKFAEAAKAYEGNPVAVQLRAMNILYEGLRAGGSLVLVPSSILDVMNLGGRADAGPTPSTRTRTRSKRATPKRAG